MKKDITDYSRICSTPGCENHPDIYNTRCDLCFDWYRQEKRVKDNAYHAKMALKFKDLDDSTIEIDGIDYHDYPDFCDAYISNAYWNDGKQLTDEELESLHEYYASLGILYDLVQDWIY